MYMNLLFCIYFFTSWQGAERAERERQTAERRMTRYSWSLAVSNAVNAKLLSVAAKQLRE
jgi:hypothetical protein